MKVILNQDLKSLGKNGSMVNVNDGYARNYLIPKGLAVEESNTNVSVMKSRQDAETGRMDRDTEHARALAAKLNDAVIEIKAKAGESGKLFGSITSKDIADAIKSRYKVEIDKHKIIAEEAIKSVGEHPVELKLFMGISATIKLKVVKA